MQGFRVWDKNTEQMYYDEFVIGTDGELYRIVFVSEINEENVSVLLEPVSKRNCIVMWKSDYKDMNGSPIYENDIVGSSDGKKYRIKCNNLSFHLVDENGNFVDINCIRKVKIIGFSIGQ